MWPLSIHPILSLAVTLHHNERRSSCNCPATYRALAMVAVLVYTQITTHALSGQKVTGAVKIQTDRGGEGRSRFVRQRSRSTAALHKARSAAGCQHHETCTISRAGSRNVANGSPVSIQRTGTRFNNPPYSERQRTGVCAHGARRVGRSGSRSILHALQHRPRSWRRRESGDCLWDSGDCSSSPRSPQCPGRRPSTKRGVWVRETSRRSRRLPQ